jgi:hypothetical protein
MLQQHEKQLLELDLLRVELREDMFIYHIIIDI